jgi:hypothetical protein
MEYVTPVLAVRQEFYCLLFPYVLSLVSFAPCCNFLPVSGTVGIPRLILNLSGKSQLLMVQFNYLVEF